MSASTDKKFVLAGDIGGTKTNLGLFSRDKGSMFPEVFETFSSPAESGLSHMLRRFFDMHPVPVDVACFGVAGPVVKGAAKATNLPWDVSEDEIKKEFNLQRVQLVNDMAATAMALPNLSEKDFVPLNDATPQRDQNLALVAPGTGLGLALVFHQNGVYQTISSEGGHADFSPSCATELDLWRYLHKKFGHVSIERLLSGAGLVNIYDWLMVSENDAEPDWLKQAFAASDPARVISDAALAKKDAVCVRALDRFVSIFGATAGNLALTGMSMGGVYLGGGIPPKIISKLTDGTFIRAFVNKGRLGALLEKTSVRVVLNDRAALLGAAHCAAELARGIPRVS